MAARLFCVDGTNVVRAAYGFGGPAHREQEDSDAGRFAEILASFCETAERDIEIELIFDGDFRPLRSAAAENFRVTFSRELSADDVILDRVRARRRSGGGVTVVTADAELGNAVKGEGGAWLKFHHGAAPESVVARISGGRH